MNSTKRTQPATKRPKSVYDDLNEVIHAEQNRHGKGYDLSRVHPEQPAEPARVIHNR